MRNRFYFHSFLFLNTWNVILSWRSKACQICCWTENLTSIMTCFSAKLTRKDQVFNETIVFDGTLFPCINLYSQYLAVFNKINKWKNQRTRKMGSFIQLANTFSLSALIVLISVKCMFICFNRYLPPNYANFLLVLR